MARNARAVNQPAQPGRLPAWLGRNYRPPLTHDSRTTAWLAGLTLLYVTIPLFGLIGELVYVVQTIVGVQHRWITAPSWIGFVYQAGPIVVVLALGTAIIADVALLVLLYLFVVPLTVASIALWHSWELPTALGAIALLLIAGAQLLGHRKRRQASEAARHVAPELVARQQAAQRATRVARLQKRQRSQRQRRR